MREKIFNFAKVCDFLGHFFHIFEGKEICLHFFLYHCSVHTKKLIKGLFTNYVDKILAFFDHLPTSIDIFYLMNVHEKLTFLDYLPPPLVNIVCE